MFRLIGAVVMADFSSDEDSFCLVTSNHGLSRHIELLLHEIADASWPQLILN